MNNQNITDFFVEIDRIHRNYFNRSLNLHEFENLSSLELDFELYNRFYDGFLETGKKRTIFTKKHASKLIYVFLGELYKLCKTKGIHRTFLATFDKKNNFISVDSRRLFCFFVLLSNQLSARIDIKALKFQKWFYGSSLDNLTRWDDFSKRFASVLSNKKLIDSIFADRQFVINQDDALKLSSKWKVDKVLTYCQTNNQGEYLRDFKDLKSIDRATVKLFDACKDVVRSRMAFNGNFNFKEIDKELKKLRISLKSCKRWIKYLGLASTISTKFNRDIELNAERERKVLLNGYLIFRRASEELGWLICTDRTYRKGLRSRSFFIRVMSDKKLKPNISIRLNNLESTCSYAVQHIEKEKYPKKLIANEQYIQDRMKAVESQFEVDVTGRRIRSGFCKAKVYLPEYSYSDAKADARSYKRNKEIHKIRIQVFVQFYSKNYDRSGCYTVSDKYKGL